MAELRFYRHNQEMMRAGLDGRGGITTVGRGARNDIVVPEPTVSRQHFSVRKDGERWLLTDLSGKGTEVGGKLVDEVELSDGAEVTLGFLRAVFTIGTGGADADAHTEKHRDGDTVLEPRAPRRTTGAVRIHVAGPDGEHTFPFVGSALVGTGEQCSVQLSDEAVSRQHLRIEARQGDYVFTDLQSKNGSWVGEVRINEALVPPGCPVTVGKSEITLRTIEDEQGPYCGIVGKDPAMRRVYETIERVAPSDAIVIVFGETGTGKELVARAIHAKSGRKGAFVPVNCSALSAELVESELFGHEKGAFTGADRTSKGSFGEAEGGTLFLDEIGELPLAMQAKILRAVEGEIKKVGSSAPVRVDVRIVAATNRDLRAEVRRGTFRQDLYWRLVVVPIALPPLRVRRGDLVGLIGHFLKENSSPEEPVELTPQAEQALLDYQWPGNVRELKATIQRSLLMRKTARIQAEDILFDREAEEKLSAIAAELTHDPHADDLERVFIVRKKLEDIEAEILTKTLQRMGSNVARMAAELGKSRSTLYDKLEKLGIALQRG